MSACIDVELNYAGSKIRVVVYTVSNSVCEEVKGVVESERWQLSGLVKVVEAHGGCIISSEKPLEIHTRDEALRLVAEPRSYFIELYWGTVVDRVRGACH